jgi:oxygen-dependent protoporphyrinogen oxidase
MTRVAVVGGGITGLAAAWELVRGASEVTVFEASARLGGRILTGTVAGRPVDLGADAVLTRVPDGLQLCEELGLSGELVHPATEGTAVWVRGRLRSLPDDTVLGAPTRLRSLARSGILSPLGVGRVALDLVLPAGGPGGGVRDRSVRDVVGARLGAEAHDHLVEPLVGGIYASSGDVLSVQATAPPLAAAASGRSLVRALRSQRRTAPPSGPTFWSLRGGLGALVDRLETALRAAGAVIHLNSPVESLGDLGTEAVVVAAPARVAASLVAAAPEAATRLAGIEHASVVLAVLVYPAAALPRPTRGTGFLVPRTEGRLLTACSFGSSKWPHWARPGQVVLRASAGRWRDDRAMAMGDDELVGRVHAEMAEALGLTGPPAEAHVARWVDAFPQYRVGHLGRVARIEAGLARDLPTVAVAGAALRGIGVAACISQGRRAARQVLGA